MGLLKKIFGKGSETTKDAGAWPLTGLRETLFGDLPLERWAEGGDKPDALEPWTSFAKAHRLLGSDRTAAVETLRTIAGAPDLEPRHYLQAWHALRALGVQPPGDIAKQVLGVVVEVQVDGGLDVLAAYADHSARYLNHAGGATIWERPDGRLDASIEALLAAARAVVLRIGPWEGPRPPPPPRDAARLNFLTPSGLHFGQAPRRALAADPMGASVFDAATALMTQLVNLTLEKRPVQRGA